MIAHQVAGKAVRDALFLSSFRVVDLPAMMAGSAVLSLVAALWLSRTMVRYTPARVVPVAFAASAAALFAEWAMSFVAPRVTAIALYLHTALFGAVMISAFWSLINETFLPHSGRRAVRWITSGGTVGGVIGGIAAWRAADLIQIPTMLPLLAGIDVICLWGTWRLRALPPGPQAVAMDKSDAPDGQRPALAPLHASDQPTPSLVRLLWATPYLRNLAVVVALGAVTSGLLDYVLSAVAVHHYPHGPQLLVFFAKFWLVVSVLSFLLETLFGRIALDKLGLTVSVAILPVIVVLGSVLGIAVPGLLSMVVLRGGEASQRNSLFRAAYELLYTPVSEQQKRAAKTFIDVGCDRAGTIVAGGVAMATVALCEPAVAMVALLVVAIVCALVSVARSIPLHRGYVALLEEGLRRSATHMTTAQSVEEAALRDRLIEQLESAPVARPRGETTSIDREVPAVLELCSGDKGRVRAVLVSREPLSAQLVAFAIPLLADREHYLDAIAALVKAAPTSTGQLVDALCDTRVDTRVRRLIPRVLACFPTRAGAEGLMMSIGDDHFEVRYACGRALLKIRAASPDILFTLDRIVAIVTREVGRDKATWTTELAIEEDVEGDGGAMPTLVDRLRGDRVDRSIEHVFNVLALHFDREAVRTSFKALHDENDAVRGTALEYLEIVLPEEVRCLVWPFVGAVHAMRAAPSPTDILADLSLARTA